MVSMCGYKIPETDKFHHEDYRASEIISNNIFELHGLMDFIKYGVLNDLMEDRIVVLLKEIINEINIC